MDKYLELTNNKNQRKESNQCGTEKETPLTILQPLKIVTYTDFKNISKAKHGNEFP